MRDGDHDSAAAAVAIAVLCGTVAFVAFSRTLLPGVDLGDTGGFQAAVLWPETSARQAYPLYYALARPFVRAVGADDPARALNLFSALCAGAAVGLLAFVAGRVVRSAPAGAAAGLLLAFSYTFWSQAIIAEVYTLHLALVGACLLALHFWAARPSTPRLAAFFAIYALSFGNHLGSILLLAPFAVFLLHVHPAPRELLRARVVALALLVAAAGALLYLPNFLFVWTSVDAPPDWRDRIAAFWFDTTKADWRESTIFRVDGAELPERIAMWTWDARQQFGAAGLAVALTGAIRLWLVSRPWAVLLSLAYAISTLFAITYNVGDPHVFFLPGHFFTAFAAAAAVAPLRRAPGGRPLRIPSAQPLRARVRQYAAPAASAALLLYAGWRGWDTWPAVDRHDDRRGELLVARLTTGLDDTNAVLLSQMDWQSENALLYAARYERRALAWTRLADVLPHLPFFVRDNHGIGRDIVLNAGAAAEVLAAYGPLYPLLQDNVPPAPPLSETASGLPRGTPYVLTLLTPAREHPLDAADFEAALGALTDGSAAAGDAPYEIWAGRAGEPPSYTRAADRPFRDTFVLSGREVVIRVDSWLPLDQFRRGGFGRVLRGRTRLLTVERGASLLWLEGDSSARTVYSGGFYAPTARFRIPVFSARQLAGTPGAMLRIATPPG